MHCDVATGTVNVESRSNSGILRIDTRIHMHAYLCVCVRIYMLQIHAYSYIDVTDMKIGRRITRRRYSLSIAASRAQV